MKLPGWTAALTNSVYGNLLSALIRIKFAVLVRPQTLSSLLPHTPLGNAAQSGTDQTIPEVRLDQDIDHPGDTGSLYFGQLNVFSTWTIPLRTSFPRKCPTSLIKEGKCPRERRAEEISGQRAGEMYIYPSSIPSNDSVLESL